MRFAVFSHVGFISRDCSPGKDADGSVLVSFDYTRDAAGNPIKIERESGLGTFYH
jgi:hypothetical protein